MASKDLGTKFDCFKCDTKFYDLKRPEPVCPKCGADQRESPALRSPEKSERKRAARPVVPEPVIEEEVVEEDEEAEEGNEAVEPGGGEDEFP